MSWWSSSAGEISRAKACRNSQEEKLALLTALPDGFLIQRGLRLCREARVDTADQAGLRNGPAHPEDNAVFNGFEAGGIEGIIPTAAHPTRTSRTICRLSVGRGGRRRNAAARRGLNMLRIQ